MKNNKLYLMLIIILVVIGYLLINYPTTVGLADNCDFYRVIQPEGLSSDENNKFFYAQQDFAYVKEFSNVLDHMKFIIKPNIKNISGYESTHTLLIKCAQLINGFVKYYKYGKIIDFDIRALSILYLVIFSLAIVLFVRSFPVKNIISKSILFLLTIFIYFDKGYLVYFNSFYGEPLILVSILLYIGSLLLIIYNNEDRIQLYIVNLVSGCIFIGAKVANIPLGLIMIIFSGFLFYYKKDNKIRLVIIIGSLCMLITSIYYYVSVPKWMCDVNRYHSLFYGVLKDSEEPEEDLKYLGIDEEYLCLQGTNGYMDHKGYDMYSEDFKEEVYEKATPLKITFYYLTHLDRLLDKIKLSAASSAVLRPPYLGNYTKKDYNEALNFDERFSLWERIRKLTYDFALWIIILIFVSFIITSLVALIKSKKTMDISQSRLLLLFRIMILIFSGSQFILPVIGNGEADLIKHMFLFNVLLDMMIIFILVDLCKLIEIGEIKIAVGIISTLICIIVLIISINISYKNNGIIFGQYKNKELVWEVLEETDEYYFVASKDIIDCRYFEGDNSNLWMDSDIRKWLNKETDNGFLSGFTNEQIDKITEIPLKTILSPDKSSLIQTGEQPHYWYCIPGYVIQNADIAYGNVNREKVFMLSVEDFDKYVINKRKGNSYWLRTPYTNPRFVRVVGQDGFVYHKEAVITDIGVVPCMYIQK